MNIGWLSCSFSSLCQADLDKRTYVTSRSGAVERPKIPRCCVWRFSRSSSEIWGPSVWLDLTAADVLQLPAAATFKPNWLCPASTKPSKFSVCLIFPWEVIYRLLILYLSLLKKRGKDAIVWKREELGWLLAEQAVYHTLADQLDLLKLV